MNRRTEKDYGEKIRKLRNHFNFSQEVFAEKCGISVSSIKNYEAKDTALPVSAVSNICEALNLSPLYFFSEYSVIDCLVPATSEHLFIQLTMLEPDIRGSLYTLIQSYSSVRRIQSDNHVMGISQIL